MIRPETIEQMATDLIRGWLLCVGIVLGAAVAVTVISFLVTL
jgi:hypothetical protein